MSTNDALAEENALLRKDVVIEQQKHQIQRLTNEVERLRQDLGRLNDYKTILQFWCFVALALLIAETVLLFMWHP